MGWFPDKEDLLKEKEELRKKLDCVRSELDETRKAKETLNSALSAAKIWNDRLERDLRPYVVKCELYDQIMKGLRINVNLLGKTKKDL